MLSGFIIGVSLYLAWWGITTLIEHNRKDKS